MMYRPFIAAAFLIATVLPAGPALAQQSRLSDRSEIDALVRASVEKMRFTTSTERDFTTANRPSDSTHSKRPSVVPKIFFSALGATAGFFGGGWLGARLEPACHCDDPGLKGALIGAPIGAVVGGIAGWKFGGLGSR